MRGREFQSIREKMGLGRREYARALGYQGSDPTNWMVVKRYETDQKPIPPMVARMAWLLVQFYDNQPIALDDRRQPQWPEWEFA